MAILGTGDTACGYITAPPGPSIARLINLNIQVFTFPCGLVGGRKVITLDNMDVDLNCNDKIRLRTQLAPLDISHLIASFNVLSAAATLRQKGTNYETDEEYHVCCSFGVNLQ